MYFDHLQGTPNPIKCEPGTVNPLPGQVSSSAQLDLSSMTTGA